MSSAESRKSSAIGLFVLKENLDSKTSQYNSLSTECHQKTLELRDIINKYKR
ncbi:MAG: hypothetical protein JW791_05015 [Nanoarchaeota archaeon]|nr:hypothetical protein [Nanoarchaeota archaeon]